jgi:hypothetical protein
VSETGETGEQLVNELAKARRRIAELEASEAQHKQTEEALRESKERYRALSDGAMEAILLHKGGITALTRCEPGTSRAVCWRGSGNTGPR